MFSVSLNKQKSRRKVSSKILLFVGFSKGNEEVENEVEGDMNIEEEEGKNGEEKVVFDVVISFKLFSLVVKSEFLRLFDSLFFSPISSSFINFLLSLFLSVFAIDIFSFSRSDFTKNFIACNLSFY